MSLHKTPLSFQMAVFLSVFWDSSLCILRTYQTKEAVYMTTVTLFFTVCGAATLAHGFMKVIEVLER